VRAAARPLALLLLCLVALQVALAARVALMAAVDPRSTAFQRSQAWRLAGEGGLTRWRQQWRPYDAISASLKRAVVASEDAGFVDHVGIDWDAVETAWRVNQRRAARRPDAPPRLRGGSTITQQLAKNLLLSGERHLLRKAQEAVIALWLEAFLDKRRILEIYLNHVEWGRGVYGAQAAARRYHGVDASGLGADAAAQLAVMLPAPQRFERNPGSAYLRSRAVVVRARMAAVRIP
jgi:monofunctional biosynthetic peptidoglycan transglycosylase